jgi:hypothetical protein
MRLQSTQNAANSRLDNVDQVLLLQLLHWHTPADTICHTLQLSQEELTRLSAQLEGDNRVEV